MTTDNRSNSPVPHDAALRHAASRLPDSIEPQNDLWPGIAAAINGSVAREASTPAVARRVRWMPALAAAASLAAVALVVVTSLRPGAPLETAVPLAATPKAPAYSGYLGPAFIQTRERLQTSLDAQLDELSPQARRVVESNLRQIEQSLAAIREALELEPDNTSLHYLLNQTSRQQLELLQQFNRITGELPEGVDI